MVRDGGTVSRVGAPQYPAVPADFPVFLRNITLTGGVAPARAYIETLLPDILDGTIQPGRVFDRTVTLDLLTYEGACVGAHVHRPTKENLLVWAKQTVLASGGAGMIYRETTNPPVATGDGMAAAYRAGAQLRDMELMQFHPTVLYVAGSSRHLIS